MKLALQKAVETGILDPFDIPELYGKQWNLFHELMMEASIKDDNGNIKANDLKLSGEKVLLLEAELI